MKGCVWGVIFFYIRTRRVDESSIKIVIIFVQNSLRLQNPLALRYTRDVYVLIEFDETLKRRRG
jgi:hypothetical protein